MLDDREGESCQVQALSVRYFHLMYTRSQSLGLDFSCPRSQEATAVHQRYSTL